NLLTIQTYFSSLQNSKLGAPTVVKIKEVLSSILARAVKHELLLRNPAVDAELPRSKVVNRYRPKPTLTPEEFYKLLLLVEEPYASMIYVCVHSVNSSGYGGRTLAPTRSRSMSASAAGIGVYLRPRRVAQPSPCRSP